MAAFGGALLLSFGMWDRVVDGAIFHPSPGIDLRPEALGSLASGAEEIEVASEGVRLRGFYLPSPAPVAEPRAILFLHGNAGNASHRLPNALALAMLGADVLVIDYRGYGASEGRPSEQGAYADARAALAHLVEERGFDESRIVLFGRSLGGAIAVDLAQDRALAGVILESTFSSAADVARGMLGAPGGWLVGGRFDSLGKIERVRAPLLFFHGDRDRVIPYALGERLFEAAPEPKQLETLSGAGHNDTVRVGGQPYLERIGSFLDEVAPPGDAPEHRDGDQG